MSAETMATAVTTAPSGTPSLSPQTLRDFVVELQDLDAYPTTRIGPSVAGLQIRGHPEFTYEMAARALLETGTDKNIAVGLWALARCSPDAAHITLPDGNTITVIDALLSARGLDQNLAVVYNSLAGYMAGIGTQRGSAGFRREDCPLYLNPRDLLVEAIRLDRDNSVYYENLANHLSDDRTARLHGNSEVTYDDLYRVALSKNPMSVSARANYAVRMGRYGIGQINGVLMTSIDLLRETLVINPRYGPAYYDLATQLLHPFERVEVLGRQWTKEQLCLEAISCDPHLFTAYASLAHDLGDNKTVELRDGTVLDRRGLFLRALRLDRSGSVIRGIPSAEKSQYTWSPADHRVFGWKTDYAFATLLMALRRLASLNALVAMDPAVLEEMLSFWSLADSSDVVREV